MDVTDQITLIKQTYGGSDNTAPGGLAASKNLNYARGANITNAPQETLTVIPFTLNYQDTVGLFGAENSYVRVNVDIIDTGNENWAEYDWDPLAIDYLYVGTDPYFTDALQDDTQDLIPVNDFEPAKITNDLPKIWDAMVSINLKNNKTHNSNAMNIEDATTNQYYQKAGTPEHSSTCLRRRQQDITVHHLDTDATPPGVPMRNKVGRRH